MRTAINNITAPTPTTAQAVHRAKRRHAGSIRFSTGLLNIGPPATNRETGQRFMISND